VGNKGAKARTVDAWGLVGPGGHILAVRFLKSALTCEKQPGERIVPVTITERVVRRKEKGRKP
jgi:hypothetical protein